MTNSLLTGYSFNFYRITIKELKSFLSRVNCKITTQKLLEYFNEIDVKSRGELRFDDFARLYQKLFQQTGVSLTRQLHTHTNKFLTDSLKLKAWNTKL